MSENDTARRVVLLARPGPARDRMREALAQASAAVVLEADPTSTALDEVMAARPDVALIVLDAATDEALDRFDALLSNPSIEVLFEEAELAVGRVGWDAARWVRHLSAKLHRSGDVLPPGHPGAEPEAAAPQPPVARPPAVEPEPAAPVPSVSALSLEPMAIEPMAVAVEPLVVEPMIVEPTVVEPTPVVPMTVEPASLVEPLAIERFGVSPDGDAGHALDLQLPDLPDFVASDYEAPDLPDLDGLDTGPVTARTTALELDGLPTLDGEAMALAPLQLDEEFLTTSAAGIAPLELDVDFGADTSAPAEPARQEAAPVAPPRAPRLELELVDDTDTDPLIRNEGEAAAADDEGDTHRFQNDLADLHSRIASMELVVDRAPTQVRGAVLVLAGIGGPDAVRQLLGALPEHFPRAVLVQQRLDGGHYDKLVAQMQRATSLLVELAVPGRPVHASSVYIMPPTVGVQDGGPEGLAFNEAPGELLASLPAGDSAVLMLSGSDPNQVDAVMKLAASGALVAGQALDGCYDVAAPAALATRGGMVGKPPELAKRLADRWAA